MNKIVCEVINTTHEIFRNEGKDAAVSYFLNILKSPKVYNWFLKKDYIDVFSEMDFGEDDQLIKLRILNDIDVVKHIDPEAEKTIFLNIIYSVKKGSYLTDPSLTEIFQRHAEIPSYIDYNYVDTIIAKRLYIDEKAIYYILKSKSLIDLNSSYINKLLNRYELDPKTMAKEVLSLIDSREFMIVIKIGDLQELIERVSLNLPDGESKKFVTEVLKRPLFRKKFLVQEKQLFDFKYIENGNPTHIHKIISEKNYYNKFIDANDKQKALDLIGEFIEYDPNFLKYFDIRTLNDKSMQLDKDLLFCLIKSDYKDKLIDITNSKEADIFIKCANYLNQVYPNFNVDRLYKILEEGNIPRFIYKEIETEDIAMITHFLLNNRTMPIKSIKEYEYAIMNKLAYAKDEEKCDLYDLKNALCMNRYGLSYTKICYLHRVYGTYIKECNDEKLKKEFEEFKNIILGKDGKELYAKYMVNKFSFDKSNKYEEEIRKTFTRALRENVFSPLGMETNDTIVHYGKTVPVIRIDGEFNGLISAVGFVKGLEIIDNNFKTSLLNDDNYFTHALSTTLYSSDNPKRVNGTFILGYSDFPDGTIQAAAPIDIYSTSDTFELDCDYESRYIHPKKFSNYAKETYSELLIERRLVDESSKDYLHNIYPTYVLLDTKCEIDISRAIKASEDLGIPIVYVDTDRLRENLEKKLSELENKYSGKSVDEYIELVYQYFKLLNFNESRNFSFIKKITSELLKNVKDPNELLKAEEFLLEEMNKSTHMNHEDVYKEVIRIRKAIKPKYEPTKYEYNIKNIGLVDKAISELVKYGTIPLTNNEIGIKDAKAMSIAVLYLYEKLPGSDGYSNWEAQKLVSMASLIASNRAEFIYGYHCPTKDSEYDTIDDFSRSYMRLKHKIHKFDYELFDEIMRYDMVIGELSVETYGNKKQLLCMALSIVEGRGLKAIAKHLGISLKELNEFRNELIKVYSNNDVKKVEKKNKR